MASCLNYEKVYAINYDVDTRLIGVVNPRSLGKLRQDFYHVNFERLHQEQSQMNRRFSSSISKVSNGAATPRGDQAGTEVNPPAFTALFSPYLQKFLSSQPEYRRESVRATGMPRLSHDRLQSSATPAETLAPDLLQRRASQTNLSTQQQGNGNEHPMSQPEDTLLSLEDYYMVPSTIKNQSTASPSDFENYANEHVHPHMACESRRTCCTLSSIDERDPQSADVDPWGIAE